MRLGGHVSAAGGVSRAPKRARALSFSVFQLFTKNQNRWAQKPILNGEAHNFKEEMRRNEIAVAVAHCGYLVNLAGGDPVKRAKSIASFRDEIERAELLGIPFLVMHPGSHLGDGEAEGMRRIARELGDALSGVTGVQVLLETTAGQGTNLGYTFEQLARIRDACSRPERVGVCFDTCHVFAAGYDLRTEGAYSDTMERFDRAVGLPSLRVVHLNDSARALGSRVDRHAMLGEGEMGLAAFRHVVGDERLSSVPFILETPRGEEGYPQDVAALRSLA